ncbi:LCP family protein [Amycolatopsis sp. DSM 110486]|uniref:LCP family glycopolymer transferase n=1 Tax=Amycolatopsis sp. DSM 110486 TaxID=2865832 RepID=UPI00224E4399|nr:LCP family protein [Amycolatopsis sp. DSM 110486]
MPDDRPLPGTGRHSDNGTPHTRAGRRRSMETQGGISVSDVVARHTGERPTFDTEDSDPGSRRAEPGTRSNGSSHLAESNGSSHLRGPNGYSAAPGSRPGSRRADDADFDGGSHLAESNGSSRLGGPGSSHSAQSNGSSRLGGPGSSHLADETYSTSSRSRRAEQPPPRGRRARPDDDPPAAPSAGGPVPHADSPGRTSHAADAPEPAPSRGPRRAAPEPPSPRRPTTSQPLPTGRRRAPEPPAPGGSHAVPDDEPDFSDLPAAEPPGRHGTSAPSEPPNGRPRGRTPGPTGAAPLPPAERPARPNGQRPGPNGMPGAGGVAAPNGNQGPNGMPPANGMPRPNGAAGPNGKPGPHGKPSPQTGTNGMGPNGAAGPNGKPGPNGMPAPVPGAGGPAGPHGTSAPNGTSGPHRVPGAAGANGKAGPNGMSTANGMPRPGGPAGPNGKDGPSGKPAPQTGPNGNPAGNGVPGGNGVARPDGKDGPSGTPGPQAGPNGKAGPNGSGMPGANGGAGLNGKASPNGKPGPNGMPGPGGMPGPDGLAGANGKPGSNGTSGPHGVPGANGAAGLNGKAGANGKRRPQAGANGRPGPNGADNGKSGLPGTDRGLAADGFDENDQSAEADQNNQAASGAQRTQLTSPVGERTRLTPPVDGKRPPRQRRPPARPAGVPARSELDPLTMTDEMEAIDEATQYRRKIDHTLARFSAAHDEMLAEEDKRRERMARLTARPVALFEQTRTALQRVVAPTGIYKAIPAEAEAEADDENPEERAPQTRLQEKKQRHNERAVRIGRIVLIVLAVLVFLGTGVAWGAVNWFDAKFTQVAALDENSSDIRNADAQANDENFLMVGSDSRDGASAEEGVGTAESNPGARSDTVMVAHVPADRKRVVVVSFPRDLEINRPDCNRWDPSKAVTTDEVVSGQSIAKLNTAYAVGGPQCVTKVIQKITGLRINHFVGIDFNGFKDMVDAVHGVTINNEKPIDDEVLGKVLLETGDVTISGDQALNYVRARHVKGDPTSDYGRIKRQQAFIGALLKKVMSSDVVLDPGKLSGFITAFAKATFGDNLGVQQMMTLAQSMRGVDPSKINFMTVPTTGTANKRGNEVLVQSRTDSLFDALRDNTPLPGEKTTTAANAGNSAKTDSSTAEG